jgi:glycosyltransferase involved in cell wall biosynthesis
MSPAWHHPQSEAMTLVLVLEQRFDRTPNGSVWAPAPFLASVWPRYLEVFSHLRIVARVRNVSAVPRDWLRADEERVSFAAVPYFIGPQQYLMRSIQVAAALRRAVRPGDAVILRLPSTIGSVLQRHLKSIGYPYGVEVVGDPYDVYAPGACRHPLRPFLRWLSPRRLRRECAGAAAALYVTEHALQRRYPPSGFAVHASNVELPPDAFRASPRRPDPGQSAFTLITLEQLYKAPDILINACAACIRSALDVRLIIVGDGRQRAGLELQAARLGIRDRVAFPGHVVSRPAIRALLDEADLFVLPSRQEGLPRALIEAMARALPCIGSTVGGFPELLPEVDLVPPDDSTELAARIREVLSDPARRERMSACNLEKSRNYREAVLQQRRVTFYTRVRDATASIEHSAKRWSWSRWFAGADHA